MPSPSDSLFRGRLSVQGKGGGITLITHDGHEVKIKNKHFAEQDRQVLEKLRQGQPCEREVQYTLLSGAPREIRFVASSEGTATQASAVIGKGGAMPPRFHNPYNFVPAPPRKLDGELGDALPAGHHAFLPGRYSGTIAVRLHVVTPLLIPDAARAEEGQDTHKTFDLRTDASGHPYLPPTSVKGMLRAAYEAVTNSRLAVFPGHDEKLAFRMDTRVGLRLVPARVEGGHLVILTGTSEWTANRLDGPMYAAWLPRYDHGQPSKHAVKYEDGTLPSHGDEVECWIELFQHYGKGHVPNFQCWRVRSIARKGQQLTPQPPPTKDSKNGSLEPLGELKTCHGFVCITNHNIDRKHDERVFFTIQANPIRVAITEEHRRNWKRLIANYQEVHEDEIRQGLKGPPASHTARWSRHVVGRDAGKPGPKRGEGELADGTLLYVDLEQKNGGYSVGGLYPVNISRQLYACSPLSLLPESLRPASRLEQLSPADRVFGWVNQEGSGACRGHVRIGPVHCETPPNQAIEHFPGGGVPLAILGAPKPQQARFYVARDSSGMAQQVEQPKEAVGYKPGKGLRGRKVYPHQAKLPEGYWSNPTQDRTQKEVNGLYQEYRRPKATNGQEQRDSQNRSIKAWVKPGTVFSFSLHVDNLSPVELGGLLWLLSLPDQHFHRLGGGKPLGFGSVRLEIDHASTRLAESRRWADYYRDLSADTAPADAEAIDVAISAYKQALEQNYGGSFETIPFIQAFLRACTGFNDGLPTHYPRTTMSPKPEGNNYEWFVENDRANGPKWCLPDLANDRGLPILAADGHKKPPGGKPKSGPGKGGNAKGGHSNKGQWPGKKPKGK